MVQINWTRQATEDLQSIFEYIERNSKRYAIRQVIRLKDRTIILKENPASGRVVPELENQSLRELIEGNYRIVYKIVNKKRIDIITVHHSSRDFRLKNLDASL